MARAPTESAFLRAGRAQTLRELERWLVDVIVDPSSPGDEVEQVVTRGPRLSAVERVDIYRYGYQARLVECLEDDYPVLAGTIGSEAFESLAVEYIARHPSSSPNLNGFGRHMAQFCREAPVSVLNEHRVFFSELARLEWALVEAVHAAAPSPLDLSALAALPPEAWAEKCFVPSESVIFLPFSHPVNAYFQSFIAQEEEPAIPESAPVATVIYRQGLTVWRMDLTPAMARVLEALLASVPIGAALARMGVDETDPAELAEAERSVMIWFRQWVQAGFFSALVDAPR